MLQLLQLFRRSDQADRENVQNAQNPRRDTDKAKSGVTTQTFFPLVVVSLKAPVGW